jgi:hypothetical protein
VTEQVHELAQALVGPMVRGGGSYDAFGGVAIGLGDLLRTGAGRQE